MNLTSTSKARLSKPQESGTWLLGGGGKTVTHWVVVCRPRL